METPIKNVLVIYYVHNYKTLKFIEKILKKRNVKYKCISSIGCNNIVVKNRDLIISVGGDGTFLRVAHHVYNDTPIMTVSSELMLNEGFFSRASREDFEKKFIKVLQGKYKITKLPRLGAKINGKRLEMLSVNEIFVGSRQPYHTSRYIITVGRKSEFQKSSGVLITTNAGSTGWAGSAAKKKLAIPRNGFGYVVREPYSGRLTHPKLVQGVLARGERIKIKSLTHKGIAVIDSSYEEHKFVDGDVIEVGISDKPVSLVEF